MKITKEKIDFEDGLTGEIYIEPTTYSFGRINPPYFFVFDDRRFYYRSRNECYDALHECLISGKSPQPSNPDKQISESEVVAQCSENIAKYESLKIIVGLISALGYIVILSGAGIFLFLMTKEQFLFGFVALIVSIIIALPLLAYSNLIQVFIDIEDNTRKTISLLKTRS